MRYAVLNPSRAPCCILMSDEYATQLASPSIAYTQSSAIDFKIDFYFQMGSTGQGTPQMTVLSAEEAVVTVQVA
jgi:hypothetical protein